VPASHFNKDIAQEAACPCPIEFSPQRDHSEGLAHACPNKFIGTPVQDDVVEWLGVAVEYRRHDSSASGDCSNNAVELIEAVAFKRRGIETRLVLPGMAQQDRGSRCDPALVKAIARGRAWFEGARHRSRPIAAGVGQA
jgi:hypothetical protein